jgi:hypothetical protein
MLKKTDAGQGEKTVSERFWHIYSPARHDKNFLKPEDTL